MIQFLLQANPSATKVRGEGNLVPLHNALFNESDRRIHIVKCLLDADPTAAKLVNSDGDTSFHIALDQECGCEVLDHLIRSFPEGVDISNDIGSFIVTFLNNFNKLFRLSSVACSVFHKRSPQNKRKC